MLFNEKNFKSQTIDFSQGLLTAKYFFSVSSENFSVFDLCLLRKSIQTPFELLIFCLFTIYGLNDKQTNWVGSMSITDWYRKNARSIKIIGGHKRLLQSIIHLIFISVII